ncbi:MAG: DMT family transporter [Phycisphaerae bacterium]
MNADAVTPGKMAVLLVGVLACSTAVLFIKAGQAPPVTVAVWRLAIAAVALSPLFFRALRANPGGFTLRHLASVVAPAAMLTLHFWSWIYGARFTTAANATLLTNLAPAVMPLALFILIREKPKQMEIVGTVVALAGVLLLTLGGLRVDGSTLFGDAVCTASMVGATFYLALARLNRHFTSVWLYIVPVYAVAALFGALLASVTSGPRILLVSDPMEWLWILGLAFIPTVVGHSSLNRSMRVMRPQVVSVFSLGQFLSAGVLGWLLFGELPAPLFYPAALLMVIGSCIVIGIRRRRGRGRVVQAAAGVDANG